MVGASNSPGRPPSEQPTERSHLGDVHIFKIDQVSLIAAHRYPAESVREVEGLRYYNRSCWVLAPEP